MFTNRWNGIVIDTPPPSDSNIKLTSDASGTCGCGAWSGRAWFQLKWDEQSQHLPIAVKELILIIIAMVVWGETWRGTQVLCSCDNQEIVAALAVRSSRETHIMHMLRCLFFIEAHYLPGHDSSEAFFIGTSPVDAQNL